jgi:hypothetical protein
VSYSRNPLVTYAKIAKSFQNMYRQRDPAGRYTITIASAMSALLLINIWSLVLLVSLLDHGWLASRRKIGPVEFAAMCAALFTVEIILVDRVFTKVDRDERFASRVAPASPRIATWYLGISIALLGVTTILRRGLS